MLILKNFGKVGCIRYVSSKNQREKSIDNTKKDDEFLFPVADVTAKLSGRDNEFREPTERRKQTERSEVFSGKLQGEPGKPQPTESKVYAEARADFWSIQGDFVCRHHNEPRVPTLRRVLLHVPKEETLLIPLKYIAATRSTYTDLEEKRVDDCWNLDSSRSVSDSSKGFTKFTLLKEKLPTHICRPGGE